MKNIYFIIIAIICILFIMSSVRKGKFSVKESFFWMLAALIMLLLSIFPYSINSIAKFFGVSYPPTLLLVFCCVFLIYINFRNSKKIAEQNEKIIELAQNVSLLREKQKDQDEK